MNHVCELTKVLYAKPYPGICLADGLWLAYYTGHENETEILMNKFCFVPTFFSIHKQPSRRKHLFPLPSNSMGPNHHICSELYYFIIFVTTMIHGQIPLHCLMKLWDNVQTTGLIEQTSITYWITTFNPSATKQIAYANQVDNCQ